MQTKNLTFSIKEDSIGWLEWDQPDSSVNLLSLSFMEELSSTLNQIEKEGLKALVVVSKKSHNFCLGADIKEIQKIKTQKEMRDILDKVHDLFLRFEQLNFAKIVAIQGACLGGGLEWTLCFDYRLSADSSHVKMGLPEVQLGLIPGFGGCLRLPQLVGLKQSLKMILTGKSLTAQQAQRIGLVDEKVPSLLLEKRALELAREIVKGSKQTHPKKNYRNLKPYSFFMEKILKTFLCFLAKKQTLKKTKGFYPAPLKALEVIQKTYGSPISRKKLELEKKAFCEVYQTSVSKNLIRVFTIIDKAKKINADTSVPSQKQRTIKHVGILGAGTMGRSIAYTFADKGFKVRLVDNNEQSLCEALNWTEKLWEQQKQKKKINSYEFKQKMNNLSVSSNVWGFSTLDLLIEALPENKKLKQEVIADISKKLNPECLFGSNSSSLCISDLAKNSLYPENFFGLHFFNPAHKMPLVEISLRDQQAEFPLNTVKQALKKIGKIPLLVKDSPGFIVNRLLITFLTEALFLYEEGCEIENIDYCYREEFGLPLGPFELMDKIGLDICLDVISHLENSGLKFESPKWTNTLTKTLGQGEKSRKGFYIYDNNKKISINEKTKNLERAKNKPFISNELMIQRGIYRMINEGNKLLKEKIIESEEDIDLALILGAGFPPFLGGPMNYAKNIGLPKIKEQLKEFENQYGARFRSFS